MLSGGNLKRQAAAWVAAVVRRLPRPHRDFDPAGALAPLLSRHPDLSEGFKSGRQPAPPARPGIAAIHCRILPGLSNWVPIILAGILSLGGCSQGGGGGGGGGGGDEGGGASLSLDLGFILKSRELGAGSHHTCALPGDGTVSCWGANESGQLGDGTTASGAVPVPVQGVTAAVAVTGGGRHSCALLADGSVRCWGANDQGQLGDGRGGRSSDLSTTPVAVLELKDVAAVAAGGSHTCAATGSGLVFCWGSNRWGQLGDGSDVDYSSVPVMAGGIGEAWALSAGGAHTCALVGYGFAACWGDNAHGQLGTAGVPLANLPVTVEGIQAAVAVAAGNDHSCVALADRSLRCWGSNEQGQLGAGTGASGTTVPGPVLGITAATGVVAGAWHVCSLLLDGSVQCWGANEFGQLGDGTRVNASLAVRVNAVAGVAMVAAGDCHTCARLGDGSVECWGCNPSGELGEGDTSVPRDPDPGGGDTTVGPVCPDADGDGYSPGADCSPVPDCNDADPLIWPGAPERCDGVDNQCPGESGFGQVDVGCPGLKVAVGRDHSCAMTAGGLVYCWGYNFFGQLGDGSTALSKTPVPVSGINTAAAVAAGNGHSCSLTRDGAVRCWGLNNKGQLGHGDTVDTNAPVAPSGLAAVLTLSAGALYTCAVEVGSSARCWGTNVLGQIGDGTTIGFSNHPVAAVPGLEVDDISAGTDHTCAVLAGGSVACWGSNNYGQLGDGTTANSRTPVSFTGLGPAVTAAAGRSHSCALLADSSVQCWGANNVGQLGDGTTVSRKLPAPVPGLGEVRRLSGFGSHVCAVLGNGKIMCWGYNADGQLGNGSVAFSKTPVEVQGIGNALEVAAGTYHTCAALDDGHVKCWGRNLYGQLGNGATGSRSLTPVQVLNLGP